MAAAMVVFLLVESLMYPLLYRFPAQKAIAAAVVTILVLVLGAFALASVLPDAALDNVLRGVDWMAEHAAASIAAAVAVALAALAVSILCSLRIYRTKEL